MKDYKIKLANMAKEQSFTLYPYDGGDMIILQSDKRFMRANLRTGEATINGSNKNYANSISLLMNPIKCQLPQNILIQIQEYLWINKGRDGNLLNVLSWSNKELFST